MKSSLFISAIFLCSTLSGCLTGDLRSADDALDPCEDTIPARDSDGVLHILTYDIFQGYTNEMIEQFVNQSGIEVEIIRTDDAGGILDQMMLTKSAPQADLMIGLDNTYLPTALKNCLLIEHSAQAENFTQSSMEFYEGPLAIPFDEGDVCLNYDEDALSNANMSVPTSLWNLTEPQWNGKMAFPSPITSSPGRAFLAATHDYFNHQPGNESGNASNWWKAIAENNAIFTSGWTESYTTYYTGGFGQYTEGYIGGAYITISYCHSPGVEAHFTENYTHSTSLTLPRASFHQVEYAGVINGAAEVDAAQQFISYLISQDVNSNMPIYNSMYSVLNGSEIPETNGYRYHSDITPRSSYITSEMIELHMESWLEEWTNSTK